MKVMALKMIPLKWAMKTNTLTFPVLVKGRIITMTAFEKGEGQWDGRFPCAFAICTPDTEIETVHCHRKTEATKDPRRIWVKNSNPVMFRWEDKAREVALAWAAAK